MNRKKIKLSTPEMVADLLMSAQNMSMISIYMMDEVF